MSFLRDSGPDWLPVMPTLLPIDVVQYYWKSRGMCLPGVVDQMPVRWASLVQAKIGVYEWLDEFCLSASYMFAS